jgi:hypothetical protein
MLPALLALIFPVHARLSAFRRSHGLEPPAPWEAFGATELVGSTVLAGFRGFVAVYLWYQAEFRMMAGREQLPELLPLYRHLESVQPRHIDMWRATGNRLAFDAAAKFGEDPEAQWPWIERGIDRMRRGAVRVGHQPSAHRLYEMLGFALLHKCTPKQDAMGWVWRRQARQRWGEDPFRTAAEAFRRIKDYPGHLPARARFWPHTLEWWAFFSETLEEEQARLLECAAAWDELEGSKSGSEAPSGDPFDHRRRVKEGLLPLIVLEREMPRGEGEERWRLEREAAGRWVEAGKRWGLLIENPGRSWVRKHLPRLAGAREAFGELARHFGNELDRQRKADRVDEGTAYLASVYEQERLRLGNLPER